MRFHYDTHRFDITNNLFTENNIKKKCIELMRRQSFVLFYWCWFTKNNASYQELGLMPRTCSDCAQKYASY